MGKGRAVSEFRDEMRLTMAGTFSALVGSTWLYDHGYAVTDAVLAMPEMQAIKAVIRRLNDHDGPSVIADELWDLLPSSLIAWALDGDQ